MSLLTRAAGALLALLALASVVSNAAPVANLWSGIKPNPSFSVLKSSLFVTTLQNALKLSNFTGTVFAPNDQAFVQFLFKSSLTSYQFLQDPALVRRVVLYHMVPAKLKAADVAAKKGTKLRTLQGGKLDVEVTNTTVTLKGYASRATVVATDIIETSKATVHVVDQVLVPVLTNYKRCRSVYSLVAGSPRHSFLKAGLDLTGYAAAVGPAFKGTVFAPTDAAFEAVAAALNTTVAKLTLDKKLLASVVLYHVLPTRLYASDITQGLAVTTLAKLPLTFDTQSGLDLIKGIGSTATITKADLFACDAVLHVIDTVLLPTRV